MAGGGGHSLCTGGTGCLALLSDNLGSRYGQAARNKRLPAKAREAAALFAVAEAHVNEEDGEQGFAAAQEALELYRDLHDESGIADSVRVLAHVYIYQGKRKEASTMCKEEMERIKKSGDMTGEARVLLALAEVNSERRGPKNREQALVHATEAQMKFHDEGNVKLEATAMITLANIYLRKKGDGGKSANAALMIARNAKDLFEEVSDQRGEGVATHVMAAALVSLSLQGVTADEDLKLAPGGWVPLAKRAQELFEEARMRRLVIFEMSSICAWYLAESPRKALKIGEDALQLARELGSAQEANLLGLVVRAHIATEDDNKLFMQKQIKEAVQLAKEGVNRFRKIGNKYGEGQALCALLLALLSSEETAEALRTAQDAVKIFRELGDEQSETIVLQLMCQMYLKRNQTDKAKDKADSLSHICESFDEKCLAFEAKFEAHLQENDFEKALETAQKLGELAAEHQEYKKEACVKLLACNVFFAQGDYDAALALAREAQAELHDLEAFKDEANALHIIAELCVGARDHEAALRAAEKSLRLTKEYGTVDDEVQLLYLIAQVRLLQLMYADMPSGVANGGRYAAAAAAADAAIEKARETADLRMAASALCASAQIKMTNLEVKEALVTLDEAAQAYKQVDDERGLAATMCIEADCRLLLGTTNKAKQLANKALTIFRAQVDSRGEWIAQCILWHIEGPTEPAAPAGGEPQWTEEQWKQYEQYQMQMAGFNPETGETEKPGGGGGDQAIVKRVREDTGNRLDVTKLEPEAVRNRLREIVLNVVDPGEEDEEFEMDLPLMQVGVTSKSAVELRNALQEELPTVNFPMTIVFDYPSINAVTDLICESA